jgi:hypothetical protein
MSFTQLPAETAEIFDRLTKGQFLSANSHDPQHSQLYQAAKQALPALQAYFSVIDFRLQAGPGCLFLTKELPPAALEEKLSRFQRLLDGLAFLLAYDPGFGPGTHFQPARIWEACQQRASLRQQLDRLPARSGDRGLEKIRALARQLERESFCELTDERSETYHVLMSWTYLETLIDRIEWQA